MTHPVSVGGEALSLIAYDGKQFRLESPRAFAPGQPMNVRVDEGESFMLDLKSTGSIKRADGRFEVRARSMTMTRQARERLDEMFPPMR